MSNTVIVRGKDMGVPSLRLSSFLQGEISFQIDNMYITLYRFLRSTIETASSDKNR